MEEHLAQEALDALRRQLAGAAMVEEAVLARSAGAVPVEDIRNSLPQGNILFAGDAGGLAHPLTGAGIHPAVVSGEAAGQAAAEWAAGEITALPAYEAKMRSQFGETLARALRHRQLLAFPLGAELGRPGEEKCGWSVVRGAFEQ